MPITTIYIVVIGRERRLYTFVYIYIHTEEDKYLLFCYECYFERSIFNEWIQYVLSVYYNIGYEYNKRNTNYSTIEAKRWWDNEALFPF